MFSYTSRRTTDALLSMAPANCNWRRATTWLPEFAATLERLEGKQHGFSVRDIDVVEAAWGRIEPIDFYWAGAFVMRLHDGRQVYVGSCSTPIFFDDDYELVWSLIVEVMPASTNYLSLPNHLQPDKHFGDWWSAPEHLNRFLRKLVS